jgi:tRNA A58 N-methylase Trm61
MLVYVIVLFGLVVIATAAYAGFRAAPWLPTRSRDLERILALAEIRPGSTVYEFGAGDGRLLKLFAKTQAGHVEGYEISLIPFIIGFLRTVKLRPRVHMRYRDFLKVSATPASTIFCFLTPPAMQKLQAKFSAECKPGTRIISYAFPIPQWVPKQVSKPNAKDMSIYSYQL